MGRNVRNKPHAPAQDTPQQEPKNVVAAPKSMEMPDSIEDLKQRVSMLFVQLEEGGSVL